MARLHAKYRRDDKGRKVLQVYQAEFYNAHRHPKQKRISLGTRDKSAALQGLAEMDRKYMARLFDPWTDRVRQEGMFVGEGIKAFLKSRVGRSPKTIKGYTDILRLFRKSLPGGFSLQALASRHVETFLAGCNLNTNGRRTYVRHLGVFFRWCLKEGTMYQDPTPQRERNSRREKRTVHAFLSEAEVEELLRVIEADAMLKYAITDGNRWLTDVIRFAVGTGLRRGEVCNLRWSAVDLKGQMLTVKNTEDFATKSGHERPVPLVGDAPDCAGAAP